MENSGTLVNADTMRMRPVPVVRPITAVPIGRPMATTEPNAINRMIMAASRPTNSEDPGSGCDPHDAYSPPISASRSAERPLSTADSSSVNGSVPRSTADTSYATCA